MRGEIHQSDEEKALRELYDFLNQSRALPAEQKFRRGEILYHEGDEPQSIYAIRKGMFGLFHISEGGKETFLRIFKEGSIMGHRSFFAEEAYHATAVALAPSVVASYSSLDCEKMCGEESAFLKLVAKSLSKDLKSAELRLAGLTDKSAEFRISETLVYLKRKHPDHIWTRKEIADYSGSTIETVTRVMTKLSKEGVIEKQGRDYKILKLKAMLA